MTEKNMKILIIADDTYEIAVLVEHLSMKLQANITLVDTLRDAGELLATGPFDAILSQWKLSDGAGLDLLQSKSADDVPLIVLEDHLDAERILTAMRLGAADVLCFPVDCDDLTNVIRRVIHDCRIRQREAVRANRLRRLSTRLIQDRRELRQRIDLICNDIVTAYQRMAEKVVSLPDYATTTPSRWEDDQL